MKDGKTNFYKIAIKSLCLLDIVKVYDHKKESRYLERCVARGIFQSILHLTL